MWSQPLLSLDIFRSKAPLWNCLSFTQSVSHFITLLLKCCLFAQYVTKMLFIMQNIAHSVFFQLLSYIGQFFLVLLLLRFFFTNNKWIGRNPGHRASNFVYGTDSKSEIKEFKLVPFWCWNVSMMSKQVKLSEMDDWDHVVCCKVIWCILRFDLYI